MSLVESRYAEALLSCAATPDEADSICAALREFAATAGAEEPRAFLMNPVINADVKKKTIAKLLPQNAPLKVVHFLWLLVDKGRLGFLSGILWEYETQMHKMREMLDITVHSAEAVSEDQLEEIRLVYMKKYGASAANIKNRVDPALLGGICVQIGDVRVDDTLQSRLRGLAAYVMDHESDTGVSLL